MDLRVPAWDRSSATRKVSAEMVRSPTCCIWCRRAHWHPWRPNRYRRRQIPTAVAHQPISFFAVWADIRLAGSLLLAVRLPTMFVGFTRYSRDQSFSVLRQRRALALLANDPNRQATVRACGELPGPAGRVEGPGLRSPSLVQGAGEESVSRLHRFGNRNPDGCQVAKQQFPNG